MIVIWWSRLVKVCQDWTRLGKVGQGWSRLVKVGQGRSRLVKVGQAHRGQSGQPCYRIPTEVPTLCKPRSHESAFLCPLLVQSQEVDRTNTDAHEATDAKEATEAEEDTEAKEASHATESPPKYQRSASPGRMSTLFYALCLSNQKKLRCP